MNNQGLVVNRWKRYGKDRLYVTGQDDAKVGFFDLVAGEAFPESPECMAALIGAVEGWKAEQEASGAAIPAAVAMVVALEPAPTVPEGPAVPASADVVVADAVTRPWVDLATNQAGAEARQQALAARAEAPVKSTLARVLGVHTNERAWRIGADGEEKVAAQLDKVAKQDPRWQFLHAIPVGDRGSDIDHLIIGPGGIFTVNAKNHPKAKIWVGGNTFMVNGHKQPYVRNSRYEATRAAKFLTTACGFPVHVEGLIVTVNAADVVIKSQPDGVSVTWRNNLAKWVLAHGDIHTPDTVAAIYEAARRSTTWRT